MLKKFENVGTTINRKESKKIVGGTDVVGNFSPDDARTRVSDFQLMKFFDGDGGSGICSNHGFNCSSDSDCGSVVEGSGCTCSAVQGSSGMQICHSK
jgi:hypothetical protein